MMIEEWIIYLQQTELGRLTLRAKSLTSSTSYIKRTKQDNIEAYLSGYINESRDGERQLQTATNDMNE